LQNANLIHTNIISYNFDSHYVSQNQSKHNKN
jgi:hypothetical protein